MNKVMKFIYISGLLAASHVVANDNIVLGPPPVSYSTLQVAGSESSVDAGYMSFTSNTMDMTGLGLGYSYTQKNDKESLHYFSLNYTGLDVQGSGSLSNATGSGAILSGSYLYGHNFAENLTGFIGGNVTWMHTDLTVSGTNGSDTTMDTTTYGLTGGFQYDYKVSFGSFIPWAFASVNTGSSKTDMSTFGTNPTSTSTTTNIDATFTYQLGFDFYIKAINSSLSSMYQSNDSGTLVSFFYSYKF